MPNKLLTLTEAAPQLRLSVRTLRLWITEQRFPATRVGGRWLVKQKDVDDVLAGKLIIDPAEKPNQDSDSELATEMGSMLDAGKSYGEIVDHFVQCERPVEDILESLRNVVLKKNKLQQ